MIELSLLPFILFIVVIISSLSERINIPYPLLLVIAGLVVGFIPGISMWHPPPEAILSIFLPPILFSAARLTAWRDIQDHLFRTIGSLSILLVIFSMSLSAVIINYFLPDMNLAAALALGAIIAPTDTVAACSIMQRMQVKQRIIRTVEIESLFNDAMGIVLFKVALFYVFFGSIHSAMINTHPLWISMAGIGTGVTFAYFSSIIVQYFLRDVTSELPIIMNLVLAYVSYLFADEIGASGVLAVVSAGLFYRRTEKSFSAQTRLMATSVWETLLFFLNGLIFIAIGIQFPTSLNAVNDIPHTTLFFASALTITTLLFLRFIWILCVSAIRQRWLSYKHPSKKTPKLMQSVVIISWSGMRGLVSLALALSLPYTLPDNTAFPYRDLLIFLTFTTILFTLIVQGLSLPWVIKRLKGNKSDAQETERIAAIYNMLTKKAIQRMQQQWELKESSSIPAKDMVKHYYANRESQIATKTQEEHTTRITDIIREARDLLGNILEYERTLLRKLRNRGDISEEIYFKLLQKIDRDEVGFESYH
ncbi:MAG: Na+/H+ antiporter [Coxiellaceae bacterium]|nr:Na+/H+ antiporter [Coxiellaceae bacterium]|tara:strand:+ start:376 stop:1980 length:1605 start_codon:yes stop_codon:yes gene_type:complete